MFSSYVEMLAQACLIMMIWRQLSENLNVNAKFNGTLLLSATVKCAFLFVLPKQNVGKVKRRKTNEPCSYIFNNVCKEKQTKRFSVQKGGKQTNLKTDAINLRKKALACLSAKTIQTHKHKERQTGKLNR